MKILIVEDEPGIRQNIIEMLRLKKYEAIGAANGLEALDILEKEQPGLIFCDIMMPHMNGFELIERVKSMPALADIPFVFLTAMAEKEDKQRGLQAGAADFLVKPFSFAQLLGIVQRYDSGK